LNLTSFWKENEMKLHLEGNIFSAESSFAEKDIPKGAGFRWSPEKKQWWTNDTSKAYKLLNYANDSARIFLEEWKSKTEAKVVASIASTTTKEFPAPEGLAYMPFQKAGIDFAINNINTLIADEMGLGKTIQAIGIINSDPTIQKILVICPASLKLNWERELNHWLVNTKKIVVINGNFPEADIAIINYDILAKHAESTHAIKWDLLIVDECHYCKNPKAKRTQQIIGYKDIKPIPAKRKVFLTGTPIVNRPIELWPVANFLDPKTFNSFWGYAKQYCAAYQNKYGWDLSGASNLDELQLKLRSSIMVRRMKKDVLTELPAKVRQVIVIPSNGCSAAINDEKESWNRYQENLIRLKAEAELAKAEGENEYKLAIEKLRGGVNTAFAEMAKMRHAVAVAKAPYVAEAIKEMIDEDSTKKVVVFAHHHDVVDLLMSAFGKKAVRLTGMDSMTEKHSAVDLFQNDPIIQVFVGSITAAGVGITLTSASHVIFAELDWVPGNISQAEDRLHRIGQINSVLVQHIVLDGSLDVQLAQTIVRKQEIIETALDGMVEANIPVLPVFEIESTIVTKKDIVELTSDQILAIHNGLMIIARMCDGAINLDGTGFNKFDSYIGRNLADKSSLTNRQAILGRKILIKYKRQLPEEIYSKIIQQSN
jgi:SWI/SNF-related matrix-associated actin-dependent regulator 1 of chromatin subfamily A